MTCCQLLHNLHLKRQEGWTFGCTWAASTPQNTLLISWQYIRNPRYIRDFSGILKTCPPPKKIPGIFEINQKDWKPEFTGSHGLSGLIWVLFDMAHWHLGLLGSAWVPLGLLLVLSWETSDQWLLLPGMTFALQVARRGFPLHRISWRMAGGTLLRGPKNLTLWSNRLETLGLFKGQAPAALEPVTPHLQQLWCLHL